MNKKQNINKLVGKGLKLNRFKQWVTRMDEKDKSLSPMIRKSKWVLTISGLFFLFGLSFIWFPSTKISSMEIKSPVQEKETITQNQSEQNSFEMPVDSFENQLIHNIHETSK